MSRLLTPAILLVSVLVSTVSGGIRAQDEQAWKKQWALQKGFVLKVDAAGFEWPTAIAFVPNPGPAPKDPLYFVTELLGTIKVVTNDRTVLTFAKDFFELIFPKVDPTRLTKLQQEIGMAAICLSPEHGHVFVSFTYHDDDEILRNNIVRFDCDPGTFSIKPKSSKAFTDLLARFPTDAAHFIGGMTIHEGHLFVGVGDAEFPNLARDLSFPLGKVLRMTLSGDPPKDNPFREDDSRTNIKNYIWAYGFRNPFGLKAVNGEVFAADNGPGCDRFVRVEKGVDYGYDGSDWSIGSHADLVFPKAVSPVHFDYAPADGGPLPEAFRKRFYMPLSGNIWQQGSGPAGQKSVVMIEYDFAKKRVIGRPQQVLKYSGDGYQLPVAVALGPDGLYVVNMYSLAPEGGAETSIIKMVHDPEGTHPLWIGEAADDLILAKGCMSCHQQAEGAVASPIHEGHVVMKRILDRITTADYDALSRKLDEREDEPFKSFREARENIREAKGEEKARLWLVSRLMAPKFDMPDALMPNFALTKPQAELLAEQILFKNTLQGMSMKERLQTWLRTTFPNPVHRYALVFGLGVFATLCAGGLWTWLRRGRRRRRSVAEPGGVSTAA